MGYNSTTAGLFAPALDCPAGENAIGPDRPVVPLRSLVALVGDRIVVSFRSARSTIRQSLALIVVTVLVAACGPLGDDEEPTAPAATSIPVATAVPSPRVGSTPRVVASPTVALVIASPRITVSTANASPTAEPATPRPGTPVPASAVSRSTPRVSTPTVAPEDATPPATPGPPVAEDCEPPAVLPEVIGEVQREATETVNVRVGPGLDCDLVTQIEAGTSVTVESGPVEASDRLWVLVTVGGDQGWVAEEFVPGEEVTRGAETSLRPA